MKMPDDAVFVAAVDLLQRTGAVSFEMRWTDEDNPPLAFVAVAEYALNEQNRPVAADSPDKAGTYYDAAAAMNPTRAVLRLCETMMDGGMCAHCQRPAGFEPDSIETMPADELVCWWQYDPELKTFRRGCEGD